MVRKVEFHVEGKQRDESQKIYVSLYEDGRGGVSVQVSNRDHSIVQIIATLQRDGTLM